MQNDTSIYGSADLLIQCTRQWEDAGALSDPLASTAMSLMKLEDPKREWTRGVALKELKERIVAIGRNDMSGMEMILACQATLLHKLFTQAIDKFATCAEPDKAKAYAQMAISFQGLCRQSIATLAGSKALKQRNEQLSLPPFPQNFGTNY